MSDSDEEPRSRYGGVYRDLLDWSSELPHWQNELLRRVLRQAQLAETEVEELAGAAVAEFEQQTSPFPRLSDSDVPAAVDEHDQVRLMWPRFRPDTVHEGPNHVERPESRTRNARPPTPLHP